MFLMPRQNKLPLSPDIRQKLAGFQLVKFRQELFEYYDIHLPEELKSAVNKRKCEYLAGRILAKQVLMELGFDKVDIAMAADRSPVWPEGIIGSISHTDDFAACAVTTSVNLLGLGIDIERFTDAHKIEELVPYVLNNKEKQLALKYVDYDISLLFYLTFSAKESIFKAIYPNYGKFFDFKAVELTSLHFQDTDTGIMVFRTKQRLGSFLTVNTELRVNFLIYSQYVMTACEIAIKK
jgi:enterobactin synthetase component D